MPATATAPPAGATAARALAVGVFDLFHVGHLRYLQFIRARCATLVVAVTRDATVLDKKGRAPVVPQDERIEIVRGLGWVDEALLQPCSLDDSAAAADWIAALGVDHVFIGDDWRGSARLARLQPALAARGIGLGFTPRAAQVSSSALRERILARAGNPGREGG
ncbi:adenylyltransferase/cytidyltransferase family protein [Janthinobacterium fluminis]|uniref:Adenylyltransferase/cytidyltransferase family protein n=1 Tax=Janthinobacterium fluminis TaxID=2987524 RepID=A0ABT5K0D5_9BURK|nr:adenylyltransferase/cytidyltransferase family protein [Janthinobacterium fluminis]MDC8757873.1 adenylyltransferase/cytidyltransferase family protein [Janthinobacterium fluminis]